MANAADSHARRHERVQVVMPIRIAGRTGFTKDISADGFYLEVDGTDIYDGDVCFEIDLGAAHSAMKMTCYGQVLRIEHAGCLTGVAVKIKELQLLVNQVCETY